MSTVTEADLLTVWEAGRRQGRVRRALVLAEAGGADPSAVADLSVGRRDEFVLALRERFFGAAFPCAVTCPSCAEELEIELSIDDLRVPAIGDREARVDHGDLVVRFRPITSRDLLTVRAGAREARRQLISRCVLDARRGEGSVPADELPDDVLDTVAAALAAQDPQAAVLLELDCASCGHEWRSPFDIAAYLWGELDTYVRRFMHDVHLLASAYGWSEAEVLAVDPGRRQGYLEMVTT
jgi:hypothetical protein